jgi:hypothetical protein
MRIKKDKNRNEYINAGGVWVRNFTKYGVKPLNISKLIAKEDYYDVINNEASNRTRNIPPISEEKIHFKNVVIISDGYDFDEKHKILKNLPKDVAIIAVNRALAKWTLTTPENWKSINFYVVNNPYSDCRKYLPRKHKYYPACIASNKTDIEFLAKYHGNLYLYDATQEIGFGKSSIEKYCIDDYRNPICAAIGLAFQFGVEKLMLFCCDDSFNEERPAAEKLKNDLWTYPQHIISHDIIDANLYWLSHQEDVEVKICDYSSGPDYINANYISEECLIEFFIGKQDKQELYDEV